MKLDFTMMNITSGDEADPWLATVDLYHQPNELLLEVGLSALNFTYLRGALIYLQHITNKVDQYRAYEVRLDIPKWKQYWEELADLETELAGHIDPPNSNDLSRIEHIEEEIQYEIDEEKRLLSMLL